MTVSNKPGHRGEREVSRKTIAQGRPAGCGEPVVTTLMCFVLFRTRGCGCIGHPAFPAPSVLGGANGSSKTSGASRRGIAEAHLEFNVIARSDLSAGAQRATASAEARRAKAEGGSDEAIHVVPAHAGTHTPRPRFWHDGERLLLQQTTVVMGPRFRGDDDA